MSPIDTNAYLCHVEIEGVWQQLPCLNEQQEKLAALERNDMLARGYAIQWPLEVTFLEFKPTRAFRGAPAASFAVENQGIAHRLWMDSEDIAANLQILGQHPELVKGLNAYLAHALGTQTQRSPALTHKEDGYCFGNQVPKRIRLRKVVIGQTDQSLDDGVPPPVGLPGMLLEAWTESNGAVSGIFGGNHHLKLDPADFEVVEWY